MASNKKPPKENGALRLKLAEAITTPLGFFVLALLIVESFLASVIIWSNLDSKDKITGMWMGVLLFLVIVLCVWVLVCWKPENLTFDKESHLLGKGLSFGTDKQAVPASRLFENPKAEDNR